jgi:hypothetical protein
VPPILVPDRADIRIEAAEPAPLLLGKLDLVIGRLEAVVQRQAVELLVAAGTGPAVLHGITLG